MTTTIRLTGGVLGSETILVRCNLSEASAPVEVDYCEGSGWQPTQWQCADTRHRTQGLADLGQRMAAAAVQAIDDGEECDWDVLEAPESLDQVKESVALQTGADTSHESAEDWYDSFGWHLTTEDAGDVTLQAVAYDWLDELDDAVVADRLLAEDAQLTRDEAEEIVAKARDIRGEAEEIGGALAAAVTAYERGNLTSCRDNLVWAWNRESDAGDVPASSALAGRLLLCVRS